MRSLLVFLLPLALIASPRPSDAATSNLPAPRLADVLRALGSTTLPHAWAGIWQSTNVDSDCVAHTYTGTTVSVDTLCTGQSLDGGLQLTCIGSTSDTDVNVSCSAVQEFFPGCTVTFNYTLAATRTGETLHATLTQSQVYSQPGCGPIPDSCTKTVTTATRIGAEPANCAAPVEPDTWGQVKSRYR